MYYGVLDFILTINILVKNDSQGNVCGIGEDVTES